MRVRFTILGFLICAVLPGMAQEEQRIDITSFENFDENWQYTGNSVEFSLIDETASEDVPALDGLNALIVDYNSNGNGWSWAQMYFPVPGFDLTGMREIHMWVYFVPGSTGALSIQLRIPGWINLGTKTAPSAGEWCELVWELDQTTSESGASNVNAFAGYFAPGDAEADGMVLIDNIYATRPAGVAELEEFVIYGFNEVPFGWDLLTPDEQPDGTEPKLGSGQVTPSEGSNYMVLTLGSGWLPNAVTTDAKGAFDRWLEVQEIHFDARIGSNFTGSWGQGPIVIQSGVNDEEGNSIEEYNVWDQYQENGWSNTLDDWKTLTWLVDMSKHAAALESANGWFRIMITTNNAAESEGGSLYIDNFRVLAPAQGASIEDWSVY